MAENTFIPADLIPIMVRDESLESSGVDFDFGRCAIGGSEHDIKRLQNGLTAGPEPRGLSVGKYSGQDLAQELSQSYPSLFSLGEHGYLYFTNNLTRLQQLPESELAKLIEFCEKNSKLQSLARYIELFLQVGDDIVWSPEIGGAQLKGALDNVLRNLKGIPNFPSVYNQEVEEHELAHVSFYQNHPHILSEVRRLAAAHNRAEELSSEDAKLYAFSRNMDELHSMLGEQGASLFNSRIGDTLLALRMPVDYIEDSDAYKYIEMSCASSTQDALDLSGAGDEHFFARLVILFGLDIFEPPSWENSHVGNVPILSKRFMFGRGVEHSDDQPTHEEIVAFLKQIASAEIAVLTAGHDAFLGLLEKRNEEYYAKAWPLINKLEEEIKSTALAKTLNTLGE